MKSLLDKLKEEIEMDPWSLLGRDIPGLSGEEEYRALQGGEVNLSEIH